ncbi:MAG: hypothetical protein QNJ22_07625 [Desulfosarcinaceae bacterium]|nr:hypothetical protein [Desulfosarcinaceae bacterium]
MKFWAEFMRQSSEGQRQAAAMADWISSGCPPGAALADLFRRCYGLPSAEQISRRQWQKVTGEFTDALNAYAPLWGWVPLARYDRLKRKLAQVESKLAEQERIISQLDALLAKKGLGHSALMTRFHNLITDQTQAFDQLMQSFAAIDTPDDSSDDSNTDHT